MAILPPFLRSGLRTSVLALALGTPAVGSVALAQTPATPAPATTDAAAKADAAKADPAKVVARVDGTPITEADLAVAAEDP